MRPTAALDGLRSWAILGIVLIHLLLFSGVLAGEEENIGGFLAWGILGNLIDVFFVISGFLLFLPLVARGGRPESWRAWLVSRFARLLPAYWVCLTLVLALVLVAPPEGVGTPSAVEAAVQYSALQMPARMFDPSMPVGFGVDGPLWMISVIAGFYLVLPLIARWYIRHPIAGLAAAALITIAWKEAVLHTGLLTSLADGSAPTWAVELIYVDQLPGWALSFALGMTGAWAFHGVGRRWPRDDVGRLASRALPLALAAYVVFAYLYARHGMEMSAPIAGSVARGDVLVSLGSTVSRAVLIGLLLVGPAVLRSPFEGPRSERFAELIFGLYMIHFVVLVYAAEVLSRSSFSTAGWFAILAIVVLPISIAYAWASHRWVERPARDWVRRRRGPPRVPSGPRAIPGAPPG